MNPAHRLDKVDAVVAVLFEAGGEREHIGVEDDVLSRKTDGLHQQLVGTRADFGLALIGVGLPLLIKRHDHGGRTVAAKQTCLTNEVFLAFLQRNGVDNALALHALEPSLDHVPLRRIDHHWHPRDIRLGRDDVQKLHHRGLAVEHGLVHVDVDDLRAVGNLLPRHFHSAGIVVVEDQPGKSPRTGDIGAFADVDKEGIRADRQRLKAREVHDVRHAPIFSSARHAARSDAGAAMCNYARGTPRGGRWHRWRHWRRYRRWCPETRAQPP